MEMVLRAAAIYLILLIIFKIAGRRTLMQFMYRTLSGKRINNTV